MKTFVLYSTDAPDELRLVGPGLGLPTDTTSTYEKARLTEYSPADINFLGPSAARLLIKLFRIPLVVKIGFDCNGPSEGILINCMTGIVLDEAAQLRLRETVARHLNGRPTHIRSAPDMAALNQLIASLSVQDPFVRP